MRKQMDQQKMPTKVYRYGTGYTRFEEIGDNVKTWALSEEDEELVNDQLFLAFRYRLMLWKVSIVSRDLYRQRRTEFFPELAEAELELSRNEEIFKILDVKEHREERQALKIKVAALRAKLRLLRDAAKTNEEFNGLIQADHRRMDIMLRAFRAVFSGLGLYSGTYQIIEEAARRARSGTFDPVRPRWDGTGCLAIQIQGGTSTANILSCKEPWLRIEPVDRAGKGKRFGSWTVAWYRVASKDRKPVFIRIPLMYHRDLPADAKVVWVKLVVGRSGNRKIYSLQLTLESSMNTRQEFGGGTVAVCFNGDQITYAGEGEEPQTLMYDPRLAKADELQAIRDRNRNGAVGILRAWIEREDEVPEWLNEEVERNTTNASCRRAVGLVYRLEREQLLPAPLMATLKEWVTHEDHLYQWQSDLRTNALLGRKNAYRSFAAMLRRKYRNVLLDSRRLDAPDRRSKERNDQGLHELKLSIRHSMGEDYVIGVTGVSCADMFDTWYAEQRSEKLKAEKASKKQREAELEPAE